MAWKQTRDFDPAKGGSEKGWCLKNVRVGYGIAPKFDSAWKAWLNTEQHTIRTIPAGIDVPVYFWYIDGNNGHIGVRLADGRFWSDGQYYASVEAYDSTHRPNFVGWGESINEVRVIEWTPDPVTPAMPPVGSKIQLIPVDRRTTFVAGTVKPAGVINVKDNSYVYEVRGYDAKYPGRILINSASAGGNGVALALYYTNNKRVEGWRTV